MWAVLGLLIGIFLGLVSGIQVQAIYSQYLAIAILACLDSVFGASLASLQKTFDSKIFFTGFFMNSIFAALLTYTGNLLGFDLTLATIIVFGTRIFSNGASIRRLLLTKRNLKKQKTLEDTEK